MSDPQRFTTLVDARGDLFEVKYSRGPDSEGHNRYVLVDPSERFCVSPEGLPRHGGAWGYWFDEDGNHASRWAVRLIETPVQANPLHRSRRLHLTKYHTDARRGYEPLQRTVRL